MTDERRFEALGKPYNHKWRVAGVFAIVLALFIGTQVVVTLGVVVWAKTRGLALTDDVELFKAIPPLIGFVVANLSALSILVGLVAGVRLITHQPIGSLVAVALKPRWGRFGVGAGVTAVVIPVLGGLQALLFPGSLEASLEWGRIGPALALALAITPLQCLAEELLFRGFLLQLISGKKGRVRLAVTVTATLFALLHFPNPDGRTGGWLYSLVCYGGFGLTFAVLAVREQGIELGWGIHTANNLFGLLVFSESDEVSLIRLPALFRSTHFDPWLSAGSALLALGVIALVTQRLWPRPSVGAAPPRLSAELA